ncbi:MAG: glycerol-3-phosphate 1-O-acyltransferase PlsY [SAR202 cluster bacterium]|nr:glycerol-3-phosphate 1-O-acyltransferase PlsY [SAR202 cluster bacterium]MDP6300521.1 glycerol-3-phosphate 1-O-acyltransferase PlsY [SAR202 cluster bacterium]MDP7224327.1 glycerol-3-phosphate 1-O-acyltransferase PlsY [SAR202 cluster bacterium]HJO81331.1 glycerol-3-phosphate 1-O-acyltransferase PlsY [SAR202 cluster bacterium]
MIEYLVLVPIAYLVGSLPFGLIAGKIVTGTDIRDFGSGKTGMTNVLRTAGPVPAALVLLLDMGKAVVAVVVARILFDSTGAEAAAAVAVMIGHNWPVFVQFRGGRGIASGYGGLLILSWPAFIVATLVGVSLIAGTRYVSLGSITAAVLGSLALIITAATGHAPMAYIWFGVFGTALVVVRHKDNIHRLLQGTEPKIGQRANLAVDSQ